MQPFTTIPDMNRKHLQIYRYPLATLLHKKWKFIHSKIQFFLFPFPFSTQKITLYFDFPVSCTSLCFNQQYLVPKVQSSAGCVMFNLSTFQNIWTTCQLVDKGKKLNVSYGINIHNYYSLNINKYRNSTHYIHVSSNQSLQSD